MQVLASVVIVTVRLILVITRNKIPTSWLNKSNSNQDTICLSILYYNMMEKGYKDTTRLKSKNTTVQQCYNAAALHEACSKADYSNHPEGNTLGSQSFLLS
jgi:hypothetical protein